MLLSLMGIIRKLAIGVVFIGIIVSVFSSFLFPKSKTSQKPQVDFTEINRKQSQATYEYMQKNGTPAQKIIYESSRGFSCMLIGVECKDDMQGFNVSILGRMTNVTMYAYSHPPASGVGETYMAFANAGFVPRLYAAQGIGFAAMAGFRPLWGIFRNVAFSIVVVAMVVIAFMIMFRMKMGAQTAIAIESALPRIVIALLLITFSYAIAGFLIDLMYVILGLSITLLCNRDTYCTASEQMTRYMTAGPKAIWDGFFPLRSDFGEQNGVLQIITTFMGGSGDGLANFFTTFARLNNGLLNLLPGTIQAFVQLIGSVATALFIQYSIALFSNGQVFEFTKNIQLVGTSAGNFGGSLFGGIVLILLFGLAPFIGVPLVMFLFILATIVGLFFRIYFMLLNSYLKILFYIMFAPVYMLLEAIPGQKGFSSWFRNLFGELMTFPLVAIFFITGAIIVNNFQGLGSTPDYSVNTIWTPPFLSANGPGSGYQAEQQAFLMVVGMGILFLVPDLVKMVKDSLGVKPAPLKLGLGTFLGGGGAGLALGTGLVGKGLQYSTMLFGSGGDKGLQGIIRRQSDFLQGPINKRDERSADTPEEIRNRAYLTNKVRNKKQIEEYQKDDAGKYVVDEATGKHKTTGKILLDLDPDKRKWMTPGERNRIQQEEVERQIQEQQSVQEANRKASEKQREDRDNAARPIAAEPANKPTPPEEEKAPETNTPNNADSTPDADDSSHAEEDQD